MGAENWGPNVKFVQKEQGQCFYAFRLGETHFLVVYSTKYNTHANVMRPVNLQVYNYGSSKDQRVQC
ncbi:hypothetical protein PanWU01x14_239860 [Parasponia andersonii]|uniref:Uncharacterized protein n=1 Tax=Parasponia andersonii TaxID=3476 RepID=A0A2P5BH52_PARAD|nr:hypothetical protein PanWU01x14_239860 [Parasponia andersonii]